MYSINEPHRIKAKQALEESGKTLEDCALESVIPACCSDGCEVEPDGTCPHGFPSVLLAYGMI